jgi:hypothetical protein
MTGGEGNPMRHLVINPRAALPEDSVMASGGD